jgi:hypothetical protein
MQAKISFAFDKSVRATDADGRLHVAVSHISKAQVSPYLGHEIPGYDSLGLEPDRVYQLLRGPDELEKAAPTFARLPILKEHIPVTVEDPKPELVIGAIGSDVSFNTPYLDADLVFWDATAIAGIETEDVHELSCAYRYVPVMEPGEYEGKPYDGRMTEIQGNHLALVEDGRAGPDVVVADSNPFKTFKEITMEMTKLGKALFAALCTASPKLAGDAALPALVGKVDRKSFDAKAIKTGIMALDSQVDSQRVDNVLDALLGVNDNPDPVEPDPNKPDATADDESPADKIKALLTGKVDDETINSICALIAPQAAADAAEPDEDDKDKGKEPPMKKEDVKAAMDGLRAEMKSAREAERDVRPVVGDVIGMDSAEEIYGFALDTLKVDHKDVKGIPALRALFKVAAAGKSNFVAPPAMDSADLTKRFPGADRFGRA